MLLVNRDIAGLSSTDAVALLRIGLIGTSFDEKDSVTERMSKPMPGPGPKWNMKATWKAVNVATEEIHIVVAGCDQGECRLPLSELADNSAAKIARVLPLEGTSVGVVSLLGALKSEKSTKGATSKPALVETEGSAAAPAPPPATRSAPVRVVPVGIVPATATKKRTPAALLASDTGPEEKLLRQFYSLHPKGQAAAAEWGNLANWDSAAWDQKIGKILASFSQKAAKAAARGARFASGCLIPPRTLYLTSLIFSHLLTGKSGDAVDFRKLLHAKYLATYDIDLRTVDFGLLATESAERESGGANSGGGGDKRSIMTSQPEPEQQTEPEQHEVRDVASWRCVAND